MNKKYKPRVLSGTHFMMGNYAAVEGALAAGCNFFAGYPITPANEISELMSKRLPEVGGVFVQGEDELCSVFAVTSASLAGAKAMTATASEGYNYMQEGIGYAAAVEAPMVIVDVQRCRGENYATQADVMQMRWGASGDYEIICLAPASVQELFDYTIRAFNLAEEFRNPVIVMSETTIALMREKLQIPSAENIAVSNRKYTDQKPENYLPFLAKKNGVPDFAPMGKGFHTLYSLNPHDEKGGIDWDPEVFDKLYKRIVGKIRENQDKICQTEPYYLDDAETVLVAYGSETRPALDAVEMARNSHLKVGLLKLSTVWPIPETRIKEVAKQAKSIIVVEMNIGKYVAEIERICKSQCKIFQATKNMGLIHYPEEIYRVIQEVGR